MFLFSCPTAPCDFYDNVKFRILSKTISQRFESFFESQVGRQLMQFPVCFKTLLFMFMHILMHPLEVAGDSFRFFQKLSRDEA